MGALRDLAGQAEEFSRIFVEFDPQRPASDYHAVALEEALADKGGERNTPAGHFRTPGRRLLPPDDLAALEERDPAATLSLRLYPEDPPASPGPT